MAQHTTRHWWKSIISFLMVLFTMPLGHALMAIMEHLLVPPYLHYASFSLGFVGLLMVIFGVFATGDTRQTLWGFFGGLLFWTGWVEFIFVYYAQRFGVQAEIVNGEVVTRPEYLILPATFGLWAMFMVLYLFSVKTGCNFINWWQRVLFRGKKNDIVVRPMTRHTSIVTFMELNMMLWSCYLLLMFCYDDHFLGEYHPVTWIVFAVCLIGSLFMFKKQLKFGSWGANIRFSIATVIVFWTAVEILGRVEFFKEFWTDPLSHRMEMILILLLFVGLAIYLWIKSVAKKKEMHRSQEESGS